MLKQIVTKEIIKKNFLLIPYFFILLFTFTFTSTILSYHFSIPYVNPASLEYGYIICIPCFHRKWVHHFLWKQGINTEPTNLSSSSLKLTTVTAGNLAHILTFTSFLANAMRTFIHM